MAHAHPTTPGLNLRDKPGMDGKILDQLSPADDLVISRYEGSWARVYVSRTTQRGWVFAKDIKADPELGPLYPPYVSQDSSSGYTWLAWVMGLIGLVALLVWGLR